MQVVKIHRIYNTIDFITISTTGDAADFGDLTNATNFGNQFRQHHPRGICRWNRDSRTNAMTFIQTMTTGNSQEFGDLLAANGNVDWHVKWSWRSWLTTKIQDTAEYLTPSLASVTP